MTTAIRRPPFHLATHVPPRTPFTQPPRRRPISVTVAPSIIPRRPVTTRPPPAPRPTAARPAPVTAPPVTASRPRVTVSVRPQFNSNRWVSALFFVILFQWIEGT